MIAQWTKIPVSRLEQSESQRLAHLEELLHKRVVGQQEAVSAVSRAVRRGRVGIMNPNRPIGSFLFMGPTGVGKTELSKALAEAVFGSEDAIIRVDMSEYMESHSVSKMIGSPPGYVGFDEGGQLSEQVRRHPYSVVLFDEVEKAHPDVFNVLLQVLDDGQITDTHGRKISFKNTIIIMTSNIGAKRIIEPKKLGFAEAETNNDAYEKMKAGVLEETKQTFKPEFINRIDELIVFHPLQQEDILQIVTIMTDALSKRAQQQVGITLKVSAQAKELLAKESYDAKFGARPLRRAIQTKIEDALATGMLSGKFASGDTVLVSGAGGKINLVK
jgi:ATP-dependent Clp protease ATP-binding subunit ClpC